MRTFDTTELNDFVIEPNGNISIVSGVNAVADVAKHFAYTARGEQIYDVRNGIPFWPAVFGKDVSIQQYDAALRARILQSPEVQSIESLEIVRVGDVLKYTAYIVVTTGETVAVNG